jgi:hypothetical protein
MVDGLGAMWPRTTLLRWLHLVQIARTPADRKGRAARPDPPRRLAATLTLLKEALASGISRLSACCPKPADPKGSVAKIGTCTLNRSTRNRRGCLSTAQIQRLHGFYDR